MHCGFIRFGNCVFVLAVLSSQIADAQGLKKSSKLEKSPGTTSTVVDVVLLRSDDGAALYAQQWLKVFQDLDIKFDIRRPLASEKVELKERESGYTRFITAYGTLDRSGQITFPDRTFSTSDAPKLKEWIAELKTYGVQGTPTGKPMWGLTKAQFSSIFDGLIQPVTGETEGMSLTQFINQINFPDELPLHWSVDAKAALAKLGESHKLRAELKGLSSATALSIALNENDLGFRPNRTPSGSIELLVETRNSPNKLWPIGWPLAQDKQPIKLAPKMFSMETIELKDQLLSDVIAAAEKLTATPIVVDYPELNSRDIDLEKIEVSFPIRKCNWNIALGKMLGPQRLAQDLRQDEAGRLFVWLTTMRAGRTSNAKP